MGIKLKALLFLGVLFDILRRKMETGKFYYIKNDYYKKFENYGIMKGKEDDEFGKHGRPCFYCFEIDSLYWMIPIW